jgi:hypothetical protein
MVITSDGRYMVSRDMNCDIQIYDQENKRIVQSVKVAIPEARPSAHSIAFSPDRSLLFSLKGDMTRSLAIVDMNKGQEVGKIDMPSDDQFRTPMALSVSPDGYLYAIDGICLHRVDPRTSAIDATVDLSKPFVGSSKP